MSRVKDIPQDAQGVTYVDEMLLHQFASQDGLPDFVPGALLFANTVAVGANEQRVCPRVPATVLLSDDPVLVPTGPDPAAQPAGVGQTGVVPPAVTPVLAAASGVDRFGAAGMGTG
jgi:hypothetical protein